MDLSSRLRAIVRGNPSASAPRRELTYVPEGGYEAELDVRRIAETLGGRPIATEFGECLAIDRRYESDRSYGGVKIEECEVTADGGLRLLDPTLESHGHRILFLDLETTGLSGGAGTIAFLVGCGYFDLGAFQVRQFLLTSHAAERALLAAVADFFDGADLMVTYNGKTFDVPVMETRWLFHRMQMPLERVPHFDMLHPARRLWRSRPAGTGDLDEGGCRLATLERMLFDVERVGDVSGFEIPGRFFQFLRTGDPRPVEPVLEHNRLDLVSLAAVTARAARLARQGHEACRDGAETLSLGRVYERAGAVDRAEACYRVAANLLPAADPSCVVSGFSRTNADDDIRAEALYRLGLRCRRDRRFEEAAAMWRELIAIASGHDGRARTRRASPVLRELRRFAAEALAIHMEHREHDYDVAREHAMFALEDSDERRTGSVRHRLARLDRKIRKQNDAQLFPS